MPPIRLHILGTLSIDDGEKPIHIGRRKSQALLVHLALTGAGARTELRRCIYALRRDLGTHLLNVDLDTVTVQNDAELLWVDAVCFRALVCQASTDALRAAVDLYRGD